MIGNEKIEGKNTTKPKTEATPRNEEMVYYYDEEYYSTMDN